MTTLITEKVSLIVQNTRESLSSYFLCPLFLRTERCRSGLGPDWTASAWAMYRQSVSGGPGSGVETCTDSRPGKCEVTVGDRLRAGSQLKAGSWTSDDAWTHCNITSEFVKT